MHVRVKPGFVIKTIEIHCNYPALAVVICFPVVRHHHHHPPFQRAQKINQRQSLAHGSMEAIAIFTVPS